MPVIAGSWSPVVAHCLLLLLMLVVGHLLHRICSERLLGVLRRHRGARVAWQSWVLTAAVHSGLGRLSDAPNSGDHRQRLRGSALHVVLPLQHFGATEIKYQICM